MVFALGVRWHTDYSFCLNNHHHNALGNDKWWFHSFDNKRFIDDFIDSRSDLCGGMAQFPSQIIPPRPRLRHPTPRALHVLARSTANRAPRRPRIHQWGCSNRDHIQGLTSHLLLARTGPSVMISREYVFISLKAAVSMASAETAKFIVVTWQNGWLPSKCF